MPIGAPLPDQSPLRQISNRHLLTIAHRRHNQPVPAVSASGHVIDTGHGSRQDKRRHRLAGPDIHPTDDAVVQA